MGLALRTLERLWLSSSRAGSCRTDRHSGVELPFPCGAGSRVTYIHMYPCGRVETPSMSPRLDCYPVPPLSLLYHLPSLPAIHRSLSDIIIQIILGRIPHYPFPESDIDPSTHIRSFGDSMLPVRLSSTSHDHHVPIYQFEFLDGSIIGFVIHMPEKEISS
jgi:hypothetical protein